MKTRLLILTAALCCLSLPGNKAQQTEPRPTREPLVGHIIGVVERKGGEPLPNIRVSLLGPSGRTIKTTLTSDDGLYFFLDVQEGEYLLKFQGSRGFKAKTKRLEHKPEPQSIGPGIDGTGGPVLATLVDIVELPRQESPRPTPTPRPSTTPAPSPTATPQPTPNPNPTPLSRIDEALAKMDVGGIAFNVPPSMSLNKAETIKLLLSPTQTVEELAQRLRQEGVAGDIKKDARIYIHDRMQAVLSGDGFQITPVTADILPISKQEPTQWEWDVRAQRAGALKLNVVLNAIVDLDDGSGPRPYPIRTFSQTYIVEVPWREGAVATFFKGNWQWLITTLIIPVGAWVWNRKKKKRRAGWRDFMASQGEGIFISYRRDDSAGHVGRLHDALASHFGADRVFMDIGSIGAGDDFVEAIEKAVGSCGALLVVIGKQWLSLVDKSGNRRLDSPRDFVHLEIVAALRRDVKVIPTLVQGATMPGEDVLPPPLAKLARRNAIEISDSRWQFDVERLIEALEEELSKRPPQSQPRRPAQDEP